MTNTQPPTNIHKREGSNNMLDNQVVNFLVGGKKISTTIHTLKKDQQSLLYKIAVGKRKCRKKSSGYKIHCDPNVFEAIIDYLRTGEYDDDDIRQLRKLYFVAKAFRVKSLASMLKDRINFKLSNNNNNNNNACHNVFTEASNNIKLIQPLSD